MQKKTSSPRLLSVKNLALLKKCSHILITDGIDVTYVSGFKSSNIYAVISANKNILVSDFRYKEAAVAFCKEHTEWQFIQNKENDFSVLQKLCPTGSTIGFQSMELSVERFDSLKKDLQKRRFIKLADSLTNALCPKEDFEIDSIQKAARIGDRAFKRTLGYLKPGTTEKQVASYLELQCKRGGSEKPSFDTIVLFGERSALPHGVPSDTPLKKGDFVLMDFGCTVNDFASDMTRTVVFGKASSKQNKIYHIVLLAQQKALAKVAQSVLACDIDNRARSVIGDAGFKEYFGHATGHGVGRRIHEYPRISQTNRKPLQKNMVITIEPGIYVPGFGGVRIEDMVVVGHDACRILTQAPKNLIEVTA